MLQLLTLAVLSSTRLYPSSLTRRYADQLVEARKAKQLTKEQAYDLLQDLNMFGGCTGCFCVSRVWQAERGCVLSMAAMAPCIFPTLTLPSPSPPSQQAP